MPSCPAYPDDRGREHDTLVGVPAPKGNEDAFDAARFPCGSLALGYGCLGMVTPIAIFIFLVMIASVSPALASLAVVAIVVTTIVFAVTRDASKHGVALAYPTSRDRNHLAEWLLRGVCPPCGYPLDGLAPHADGCVQCPECGSAWNLREWNRAAPPFNPSPRTAEETDGWSFREDARGRLCIIMPEPRSDAELAALRARRRRVFVLALAASGAVWLILWWWLDSTVAPSSFALIVLGAAAIAHLASTGNAHNRRLDAAVLRRLDARSCPRCESPLDPAPAISDGTHLCTHCGAAWHLPDQSRRG
jgi:uncharacterized Zn finger protein (UPF0148 family)